MSGANPVESLTFAIGNVKEQINIRDIEAITVNAAPSDSDGFVQGSLLRGDGTEVKPAKVQVKTKNASMYLMGLSKTGAQLTIDVTNCRRIEFSSMIAPDENSGPDPGK